MSFIIAQCDIQMKNHNYGELKRTKFCASFTTFVMIFIMIRLLLFSSSFSAVTLFVSVLLQSPDINVRWVMMLTLQHEFGTHK